ncbi:MAG: site-specific DNA-methyltransferase [Clostridiaceae bacterium]|nr:site-specific DNA-methyltransferase [Clostridiaceae bacterium]
MDKMKFETPNLTAENVTKIAELFPGVVTEGKVNFDLLRSMLGDEVYGDEAYEFTWVGKRAAIAEAGRPIRKTLRPCVEESKDWDMTENLYIEGDNLDVLKLLQESYLGKVKMVYIDPPYNTGNDFVYRDNFAQSREEYAEEAGVYDEDGDRLFKNTATNGRFHSDWCSMIYPRLVLARNLLANDGVIFISIDDNEIAQLRKICDEVFGTSNFVGQITWSKKRKGSFLSKGIISTTEYLLVYAKSSELAGLFGGKADENESQPIIKRTNKVSVLKIPAMTINTKLENSVYTKGVYGDSVNPVELLDDVTVKDGIIVNAFSIKAPFIWSQKMFDEQRELGAKFVINTLNFQIRVFKISGVDDFKGLNSYVNGVEIKGTNEDAYEELERFFGVKKMFDYSKPVNLVAYLVKAATNFTTDSIILDFFSGSATTAHAVMQLNAEDGGKRKFIMVQLPEVTDEKSEAYKAGYKNICEIGKERIRRAGDKIKAEMNAANAQLKIGEDSKQVPDIGFRVLKLDDTNMNDVYYAAGDYTQDLIMQMESNIKPDRTDMDLLYGCLLDWGLPLSMPHSHEKIDGFTVHTYNDGDLIACFEERISEKAIREIANRKPLRAVFRDSSFSSSPEKINVFEIFKLLAPNTNVKVI